MIPIRNSFVFCSLVLTAPCLLSAECGARGEGRDLLVSAAWLSARLDDPNLVVLSVGERADYDAGHIPGARFVDYRNVGTRREEGSLTLELRNAAELTEFFRDLGVTNDSRIVVYASKDWFSPAARVILTLDAMGLGSRASMLDGGFVLWKSEGRPVSTLVPAVHKGALDLCPRDDVIAGRDYVRANLRRPGVAVIDARLPEFYTGARIPNGQRAGHIPGAGHLAFDSLLEDNGKLKPRDQLESLFRAAGAKPGDRVVSYCHIGQQASLVYFAARYLGYDARMYDGSWEDWSAQTDLRAETAAKE